MTTVITADQISKTFPNGTKAVDNIGFSLERGEIFGFLGPNGAGKTTTVKLLCGMLTPTGGVCRVLGIDPVQQPEALHRKCGVVTERALMYDHLTGTENLLFYGSLFGLRRADCKARAKELLTRLELDGAQDRKLSTYSTGMRQRLSLARALMHRPEILFLDEPTSGLDPESAQNVNSLITELAAQGTTVFLCTHQLRYAQELCTSYGLMDKGVLFAAGTLNELQAAASDTAILQVRANGIPKDMAYRKVDAELYELEVSGEEEIPQIVKQIVDAGGKLYEVFLRQPSLEDIYFSLMEQNHRKEGENV